jgi:hypothetical protein
MVCYVNGHHADEDTIMLRSLLAASAIAALALAASAPQATAQDRKPAPPPSAGAGAHPSSGYYRRAPQVRGFVQRRGGYSYGASDVANTAGDSRVQFGATNWYRNPYLDRQSRSGPFDHGFFWDSGVSPRGGNSPYQN